MTHQIIQRVDVICSSDLFSHRALFDDVSFILHAVPTDAHAFFYRQAAAPSPVPAPRLDGEGVSAEAEAGPGDAFTLVHGVRSLGVDGVYAAEWVDVLVDCGASRCIFTVDFADYLFFATLDIM